MTIPRSFTCPMCERTSYNISDVVGRYCENCGVFIEDVEKWWRWLYGYKSEIDWPWCQAMLQQETPIVRRREGVRSRPDTQGNEGGTDGLEGAHRTGPLGD